MMNTKVLNIQEKPDSVTVKETAKGDIYFEVKCYGDVSKDEFELLNRVQSTYETLVARFRGVKPDE